MDTIGRVINLANERSLSLFRLSQICDVPYSTLKNAEKRGSQLAVSTIEKICDSLGMTMSEFFKDQ
jgi:DNA-binding Xre family transcriptional regulator